MSDASPQWGRDAVVAPTPLVDRFETEDGTVVMVASGGAHRIVRLSLLGNEVLSAVADGTTLGAVEAALLERLGPPPGGDLSQAVQEAVRELAAAGLLSVTRASDVTQS